jgi:hypothetical protein
MGYTVAQMADLVAVTLSRFGKLKWTDLTTDIQEYHALPQILQKEKIEFDGGKDITRFVQVNRGTTTRPTVLYDTDVMSVNDQASSITVGWRHVTTNMSFDTHEKSINSGDAKLVDLIAMRRHGMMVDLADKMEQYFWTILAADDSITPFGLKYWCVTDIGGTTTACGTTGAFTAGVPWTSTSPGGLTDARFRNWACKYVDVSKSDLIAKMRRAYRKCQFKPPVPHKGYDQGASRYVIYTSLPILEALESLGEAQNDNLGRDLASMDGEMVFRGRPIRWVPYLDSDTTICPVYMIDWSKVYPVFLKGWYMNESAPAEVAGSHTVVGVHLDCSYNTLCHDRRGLAVLSKTAG